MNNHLFYGLFYYIRGPPCACRMEILVLQSRREASKAWKSESSNRRKDRLLVRGPVGQRKGEAGPNSEVTIVLGDFRSGFCRSRCAHFELYLSLTELREFPCSVVQRCRGCRSLVHLSVEQGTYAVGSTPTGAHIANLIGTFLLLIFFSCCQLLIL